MTAAHLLHEDRLNKDYIQVWENGEIYRAEHAVRLLAQKYYSGKVIGLAIMYSPSFLLKLFYSFIAKNRYKIKYKRCEIERDFQSRILT